MQQSPQKRATVADKAQQSPQKRATVATETRNSRRNYTSLNCTMPLCGFSATEFAVMV
ncbi:MAG: hypothetical protein ACOYNO_05020 [Saprospiraceae bacterium]